MTDFFQRVYEIVTQIPAGKVASYGQIAACLGSPRSARTVGWAMWKAPPHLGLPCHRVVSSSGVLAPEHVFSPDKQRALLEAEGVVFKENGCVDMNRCRVKGVPEPIPRRTAKSDGNSLKPGFRIHLV